MLKSTKIKSSSYNRSWSKKIRLSNTSKKICYISLNKTYNAIEDMLKKEKIDVKKFFFIDTISRSFLPEKKKDLLKQVAQYRFYCY